MRNGLDLTPYRRATVGFDRLFDRLEAQMRNNVVETDPPFNICRDDEDSYRIVLAAPGLAPDQIDIVAQQNQLVVTGSQTGNDNAGEYLHRGIPPASFERQFQLADFMEVGDAALENGLLTIHLKRIVPETLKPRKISVGVREENQRHLEAPQEAA